MNPSDTKLCLESLKTILRDGPSDRFRKALEEAVDAILDDRMNISELPGYLRPILRSLAVSYQKAGLTKPHSAAMTLMRLK